jgi:tetratricopeptide (TPR) repeat protein
MAEFDKAIKMNKEKGDHYYYRGLVKHKLNLLEESVIDLENTLKKNLTEDNHRWDCYYTKGVCLSKLGRYDDAILSLKAANDMQPEKVVGHDSLGLAYFYKE